MAKTTEDEKKNQDQDDDNYDSNIGGRLARLVMRIRMLMMLLLSVTNGKNDPDSRVQGLDVDHKKLMTRMESNMILFHWP